MKDNGCKGLKTDKESRLMNMELNMRVRGKIIRGMGLEN